MRLPALFSKALVVVTLSNICVTIGCNDAFQILLRAFIWIANSTIGVTHPVMKGLHGVWRNLAA
jgi:hypothetical protein